jgi:hypothetical protein
MRTSVLGRFNLTDPQEAKKRAIIAVSTMIGALMKSRIVTGKALSDSILRNAAESLAGS